jgi:hypothetical protein
VLRAAPGTCSCCSGGGAVGGVSRGRSRASVCG